MADIQVRSTLRAVSGVPRDDVVNTFAIHNATLGDDNDTIFDAFETFWGGLVGVQVNTIGSYLADTVMVADGLLIELIDSPATPPNPAYASKLIDLPGPGSSDNLPQEVACCLSMVAADYVTTAQPGRHRGRVYIGPLSTDASTGGLSSTEPARPGETFRRDLGQAAEGLRDELFGEIGPDPRVWAIWSRADNTFRQVVGGWVDDEWDTVRSRGRERTTRTLWGF